MSDKSVSSDSESESSDKCDGRSFVGPKSLKDRQQSGSNNEASDKQLNIELLGENFTLKPKEFDQEDWMDCHSSFVTYIFNQ